MFIQSFSGFSLDINKLNSTLSSFMSESLQIYKNAESFVKNNFEKDFDRLVNEYTVENVLELSAKKFFTDNAEKGLFVDYVIQKNVPVNIAKYVAVNDLLKRGNSYIDKLVKKGISKADKESLINIASNVGMTLVDNLLGEAVIKYEVPFSAKFESLLFQYTVNGKLNASATSFFEKYSSKNNQNCGVTQESEIKDIYKKKTHSFLDSLLRKAHEAIDDIFKD